MTQIQEYSVLAIVSITCERTKTINIDMIGLDQEELFRLWEPKNKQGNYPSSLSDCRYRKKQRYHEKLCFKKHSLLEWLKWKQGKLKDGKYKNKQSKCEIHEVEGQYTKLDDTYVVMWRSSYNINTWGLPLMRIKSRIFFLSRSVKRRGILCYSQANNGVIIRSRNLGNLCVIAGKGLEFLIFSAEYLVILAKMWN